MAVYTLVDDDALDAFLTEYDLGAARSFKGIAEGVENSNYYLETERGRYILTLFEKRVDAGDLPYFIGLKQHLAAKGFPCPEPILGRDGAALRTLCGRPAIIVSFLDGLSPRRPNREHCRGIGAALARMHLALADFEMQRPNALGPGSFRALWKTCRSGAEALQPGLEDEINADLDAVTAAQGQSSALPRGTIHADLFPDNAFFLGNDFSGIIDFYFACSDALAYDIAICLNAWAFDDVGSSSGLQYAYSHGAALLAGYQSVRPLEAVEQAALPVLCRTAALRFFLTRMVDWTSTPADALVRPKNPLEYAQRLRFHREAKDASSYGL
ncbi:MAG: homoserine kinase [Pseudomonadota bacterium]